jgi:hypothetical protein
MPFVRDPEGEPEVEGGRDKESNKELPVLPKVVRWKDVQESEGDPVAESMALGIPDSKQKPEEQGLENLAMLQGAFRPNQ